MVEINNKVSCWELVEIAIEWINFILFFLCKMMKISKTEYNQVKKIKIIDRHFFFYIRPYIILKQMNKNKRIEVSVYPSPVFIRSKGKCS
jgi:hypothetical protein